MLLKVTPKTTLIRTHRPRPSSNPPREQSADGRGTTRPRERRRDKRDEAAKIRKRGFAKLATANFRSTPAGQCGQPLAQRLPRWRWRRRPCSRPTCFCPMPARRLDRIPSTESKHQRKTYPTDARREHPPGGNTAPRQGNF